MVIRNAVIHIEGTLPVLADLPGMPQASDVSLLCTNLRTVDGKRPTFIEHSDSWFLVPLATVRFVEMPSNAMAASSPLDAGANPRSDAARPAEERMPPPLDDFDDLDLEPDETLLQRIRDI